jgi:uncharacterized protein YodC (DUF2158 family)
VSRTVRAFKVGDTVRIKSGEGPIMTVEVLPADWDESTNHEGLNTVRCVWFILRSDAADPEDWDGPYRARFAPGVLRKYAP